MINLVRHSNNSRRVTVDEYSLLIVAHTNELNNEQLEYVNGFIIDTDNSKFAKDIIYQIRNYDDLNIALLPIFISAVVNLPQDLEIHTDGIFSMNMTDSYAPTISKISKRIHKLQVPKTTSYQ